MPKTPAVRTIRRGRTSVDVRALSRYLGAQGHRRVLVEGGPTLVAEFLAAGLIDEIFVTIAPKIFGNARNAARTMVEGYLFPPEAVPALRLASARKAGDEVYLRYRARTR